MKPHLSKHILDGKYLLLSPGIPVDLPNWLHIITPNLFTFPH